MLWERRGSVCEKIISIYIPVQETEFMVCEEHLKPSNKKSNHLINNYAKKFIDFLLKIAQMINKYARDIEELLRWLKRENASYQT